MYSDESIYQIGLTMVPGVGDVAAKILLSYRGSAKDVFSCPSGKLKKIPGIGEVTVSAIKSFKDFQNAEKIIEDCEKHNTDILVYTDEKYPKRLKQCADAPIVLYYKGDADLNQQKVLAIVGTRQATSYGKDFLNDFIEQLKPYNPLIVSGLAYGIDIIAHQESLRNGLPTLAVLGSGMDVIYPSSHKPVVQKMLESNGGVLTEQPLHTAPDAKNFPARNRIIAGMSDAVVVVEAAEKGGALITAELANSYDREVFALPGNIGNLYSKGCNKLIRNHKAQILTSAKDLEYALNWENDKSNTINNSSSKNFDFDALNSEESKIVETILNNENQILLDELSWKSQIPIGQMASSLLNLELKGIVKALPGKKYKVN